MNYEEALSYVHTVSSLGSIPGLSRISELCERFDHPERKLQFVHIAGTNGKGSVSSMLSSIFMAQGKRVGLFTSPFIYDFNERFRINNEPISNEEFAGLITRIAPVADSMDDHPSEFELDCITGFLWFYEKGCDVVVLETGLGGRLDGTNVIENPLLSVITGISLDHTGILGDTTAKIAFEKAGIIKDNCPVVIGKCDTEALQVILDVAKSKNAVPVQVDYAKIESPELSLKSSSFFFGKGRKYTVSLAGIYQPENAAVAITVARELKVDDDAIRKGLANVTWPARFETLFGGDIPIVYDGGHNIQGVTAAVKSADILLGKNINILTGVLRDKDYTDIAKQISSIAKNVFCITPPSPRALESKEYAAVFSGLGVSAECFGSIPSGVKCAVENSIKTKTPLLILGSLYMYRDVRDAVCEIISKL